MDQLLVKIREAVSASQQAEEARNQARLAYYRSVEAAHEKLTALQTAEHELLVQLLNERQQLVQQQRAQAVSQAAPPAVPTITTLPPVAEETPAEVITPETPAAEPRK